jgi:hypothetical protein
MHKPKGILQVAVPGRVREAMLPEEETPSKLKVMLALLLEEMLSKPQAMPSEEEMLSKLKAMLALLLEEETPSKPQATLSEEPPTKPRMMLPD